ncbi:MAG: hypothetical protein KME31_01695 [Tolypothrix carrinoi HA7290-LM1]|jgi:hypothetical protein|nr:hypothetical protein [Tolypothrix carrinoi HA7290-LM1]
MGNGAWKMGSGKEHLTNYQLPIPNYQLPIPNSPKNVIRDTKPYQKVNFLGESHTSADNCLKEA